MKVSDIGEFGLIRRLTERLGAPASAGLIVGVGDDAAVWRSGERALIATTDTMVEGVHFLPDAVPWCDVGWKALAVNVSDIAAMGGRPSFALVTLAVPGDADVEPLDALYDGLRECATEYGVTVAGGDVVRAPQLSITVALMGEALLRDGEPLLLRRNAAEEGDAVAVTGTLGGSAAGLRRLRDGAPADDPLVRAHTRPQPRVEAGLAAVKAGLRCGIDVSDGLVQDVGHICEESGVSAVLRADRIPMASGLQDAYPDEALALAAAGGEDYELVIVGGRERIESAVRNAGVPVTVIGEIVAPAETAVSIVDEDGNAVDAGAAGWDHLRG